jgi:hypothetical protein
MKTFAKADQTFGLGFSFNVGGKEIKAAIM